MDALGDKRLQKVRRQRFVSLCLFCAAPIGDMLVDIETSIKVLITSGDSARLYMCSWRAPPAPCNIDTSETTGGCKRLVDHSDTQSYDTRGALNPPVGECPCDSLSLRSCPRRCFHPSAG
jgi:hypothetical protein